MLGSTAGTAHHATAGIYNDTAGIYYDKGGIRFIILVTFMFTLLLLNSSGFKLRFAVACCFSTTVIMLSACVQKGNKSNLLPSSVQGGAEPCNMTCDNQHQQALTGNVKP